MLRMSDPTLPARAVPGSTDRMAIRAAIQTIFPDFILFLLPIAQRFDSTSDSEEESFSCGYRLPSQFCFNFGRPARLPLNTRAARPAGRRRGRGLRGAAGHRHRHRRLDPPARRGLRHRRHQADLRRLVPLRRGRVREQPGHARAVRPDRARRRAAARGDLGSRPVRLHLDRRAGAAGGGRGSRGRRERHADRRGLRAERDGSETSRASCPGSPRRSSCSSPWGPRSPRCPARTSGTRCPPTTRSRPARPRPTWPGSTPCATGCGPATTGPGTPWSTPGRNPQGVPTASSLRRTRPPARPRRPVALSRPAPVLNSPCYRRSRVGG